MYTKLYENAFQSTKLEEEDIRQMEEAVFTTATQDVSNINITNYVIETRSGLAESGIYLKDAYLLVQFNLATQAGADLDAADVVSLTHGAWSLFSQASLDVNQTQVDRNINPGQSFNILTKASKSHSWIIDNCHDNFYYPAKFGAGIDPTLNGAIVIAADASDNNFLVGDALLNSSEKVWVKLRLADVLGFCNLEKVLTGVNLILRLQKNTDYSSILMRSNAGDAADLITIVDQIKLYIPTIKVKSRLAEKLNLKLLEEKPQPLDWQQIGYQQLTGTGTQLSMNLFTSGRRVRHLFVMPQLTAQLTAQLNKNASLGIVNSVSECYVMMNGQQFPALKYQGANEGYVREVAALKRAFGTNRNVSSIVNELNFAGGNAIYYFDLSHQDDIFADNQKDVVIQVYFTSAETNPQTFHCCYFTDQHHKLANIGGALQISASN
jgi:hypothetical protein